MDRRAVFAPRGLVAMPLADWGNEFLVVVPGEKRGFTVEGPAAIVDIRGPLCQHEHFLFDSYDAIRARFAAALTEAPQAIVTRIDSPGGEAAGCFEVAREMRAMARAAKKRWISFTDTGAFSAAYAIACGADEVVVTLTGAVGSIGVFEMMLDTVRADAAMGLNYRAKASGLRKMDKNPHVAITPAAEAETQSKVDQMAGLFFDLVAEMRPMSVAQVRALEGSTQFGTESVGTGLADQVSTWSALIARLGGETTSQGARAMGKFDEAYGALKRAAEGDDEDAKKAKKMLKAWDESEAEGKKKGEDAEGDAEAKKKAEAEGKRRAEAEGKKHGEAEGKHHGESRRAEEEPPEEKEKREKEAKAKAEAEDAEAKKKAEAEGKRRADDEHHEEKEASALAMKALARVHTLEVERELRDERDERAKLLASRPDFAPELVAILEAGPIAALRTAVETLPKGPARMSARAAAAGVSGTRGRGQDVDPQNAPTVDAEDAAFIARKMGGERAQVGVVHASGGRALELGYMSPEDVEKWEKRELARAEGK